MTIKQIAAFQTTDGKTFETLQEAKRHETYCNLVNRLRENSLLGNYEGSRVEPDDLYQWIINNADLVREIIE